MNAEDPLKFREWLRAEAQALGFSRAAFTHCAAFDAEAARRQAWLEDGGRVLFPYLDHPDALEPSRLLEGARSALVVFFPYARPMAVPGSAPGSLKVSRYLWGPDYHILMKGRLKRLLTKAQEVWPGLQGRACVDTAPLMERQLAVRAGLGWQGRHTLLILGARPSISRGRAGMAAERGKEGDEGLGGSKGEEPDAASRRLPPQPEGLSAKGSLAVSARSDDEPTSPLTRLRATKPFALNAAPGEYSDGLQGKGGSWGFLGVLLLDVELPPDAPFQGHRCGSCRACLDACPTAALSDFRLDPRRCLTTYNLETEQEPPAEVIEALARTEWAAGCDICQEVCPWNREPLWGDPELWGGPSPLHTRPAAELPRGTAQWQKLTKGTALRRVRHRHWITTLKRILGDSHISLD